jgi:hypothetical protein
MYRICVLARIRLWINSNPRISHCGTLVKDSDATCVTFAVSLLLFVKHNYDCSLICNSV